MLLLTIIYEKDIDISADLQELKNYFKFKGKNLGICESIEKNTHFIKIFCDDKDFSEELKDKINLQVSQILYSIVIDIFKENEIYEFLADTYFFIKNDELSDIQYKIMEILKNKDLNIDEANIYYVNRKNDIINKIKSCIDENHEINIDGFITFRIRELKEDLEDISDKVVERYMVEKEYNEFIKLLKYFVDIQESKIDEVNIIITEDGNYFLRDKVGKDIFEEFLNDLVDSKVNNPMINIEDIIISGLITNAPKKIVIHGKENCNNKEILDTIKNVFTDRVSFCSSCNMCNSFKSKKV